MRKNEGKRLTEAEFSTLAACDRLIGEMVIEYGGDEGYYCYETTNSDGDIVWRVRNAYE